MKKFTIAINGSTSDEVTAKQIEDMVNDAIAEQCERDLESGSEIPGFIGNAHVTFFE